MGSNVAINVFIILTVCSIHYIDLGQSQTLQNAKDLLSDKLEGYNANLRPVANQSEPLMLYVGFELLSLIDVDEATQTVTVNAMVDLRWTDVSMVWNPADYGGLSNIFAKNDQFWTPSLVLTTTNEKLHKFGESWLGVRYYPNGDAFFIPGEICATLCTMDITYFPFDQHTCNLYFTPWGSFSHEIAMSHTSDVVGLSYFYPNGAWELVDSATKVEVIGFTTNFIVKLVIRRLPRYVTINIIIPLICLSFLNMLVFLIPTDSGERISFCITLLLSIAVFLTIVSADLPKTSTPMSMFCYYLLGILFMSTFITIAVIFSLRIYYTDESKPINEYWKRLVSLLRLQCFENKCEINHGDCEVKTGRKIDNVQPVITDQSLAKNRNGVKFNTKLNSNHENHVLEERESGSPGKDDRMCWKDVSVAFDKICFVFFLITLVAATSSLFCVLLTGAQERK